MSKTETPTPNLEQLKALDEAITQTDNGLLTMLWGGAWAVYSEDEAAMLHQACAYLRDAATLMNEVRSHFTVERVTTEAVVRLEEDWDTAQQARAEAA